MQSDLNPISSPLCLRGFTDSTEIHKEAIENLLTSSLDWSTDHEPTLVMIPSGEKRETQVRFFYASSKDQRIPSRLPRIILFVLEKTEAIPN